MNCTFVVAATFSKPLGNASSNRESRLGFGLRRDGWKAAQPEAPAQTTVASNSVSSSAKEARWVFRIAG
jgi:hypothetical protein